jgi:putative pyruvate formate lyase activating enzyme
MLRLQARGCSNINFVSPSHVIAPILEAVLTAAEQGLTLPLVYNSGGYDSLEGLRLLDGVIDIYMPDMKFGTSERGQKYAWVADYTEVNQAAVSEMHRQVGDLVCDNAGIAERGLLVRHLVLPNDLADTRGVLAYVAEHISIDTYLNLMPQYRPCYRADSHSGIEIPLRKEDYKQAVEYASEVGLTRCQVKDVFWFW